MQESGSGKQFERAAVDSSFIIKIETGLILDRATLVTDGGTRRSVE